MLERSDVPPEVVEQMMGANASALFGLRTAVPG